MSGPSRPAWLGLFPETFLERWVGHRLGTRRITRLLAEDLVTAARGLPHHQVLEDHDGHLLLVLPPRQRLVALDVVRAEAQAAWDGAQAYVEEGASTIPSLRVVVACVLGERVVTAMELVHAEVNASRPREALVGDHIVGRPRLDGDAIRALTECLRHAAPIAPL